MEIWIREQLISVVVSIVLGVLTGGLYDVLRIVYAMLGISRHTDSGAKKHFDPRMIIVFAFDLVFCLVFTVAYAIVTYAFSYGQFRWFMLASVAIGFAVYMVTLGRLTSFFTERIARLIRRGAKVFVKILVYPLRLIWHLVHKSALLIYRATVGRILKKISTARRCRYMEKVISELNTAVRFDSI